MRKLTKADQPQILIDNYVQWTADLLAARTETEKEAALENYKRPEIRAALMAETHEKCAYCEGFTEVQGYSHIEHIQPKAKVPNLAFTWDNLTIGCNRCNLNKGKLLPNAHNFVNPYDDPEAKIAIVGSLARARGGDAAAMAMIKKLKLNRTGLLVARLQVFSRVEEIYKIAVLLPAGGREFVDASLQALLDADAEYTCTAQAAKELFEHELGAQIA